MSVNKQGNQYVLAETASGIPTFKHIETNEILHGQVGPYEEAYNLYVKSSSIENFAQNIVIYDLGMGCGAQIIAMYNAFLKNKKIPKLTIVSFDLEKQGLIALLKNIQLFPYAFEFEILLKKCIEQNHISHFLDDGREFEWIFIEGDFVKTIKIFEGKFPFADIVCYDFFSPASHPHLWTYEVFLNLKNHMNPKSKLITYSSATCVRAAMLAAGFFVGFGPLSGKKAKSTIAASSLNLLEEPLPLSWQTTFYRSGAKFCSVESEVSQQTILEALNSHPQWFPI
ncbi:MnmC family methyltransferase [Silvanigrella aquatica]|uniref:MnmC-like methyltransferase domain-containing protein n=1 Tax=Silvanigrella aquatica TaxID=1915309 RepID=A0A1L4D1E9_9BACT|nr:MnmC family methyltransferase [Silvanigrella aquatica]APJ04014.1 hypothetical protein AXG55_08880 [Silvanigrella aquatica]